MRGGRGSEHIDLGSGNDLLLLGVGLPHYGGWTSSLILLGAGQDRVVLGGGVGDLVSLVIGDFAAGAGGDSIDLTEMLIGLSASFGITPPGPADNPFASGLLQLEQSGADTLLRFYRPGLEPDHIYYGLVLLRLTGVTASQLVAANFSGYDPTGGAPAAGSFTGTAGADTFRGLTGPATINGLGGDDVLTGNAFADTIDGGTGNDRLDGGFGNDTFRGGDGADVLEGGFGHDLIEGGIGDGVIIDAHGNDTIRAGDGNDRIDLIRSGGITLDPGRTSDTLAIDAGAGDDTVTYFENYSNQLGFTGLPNKAVFDAVLGDGNDQITIDAIISRITLSLGAGTDRVVIDSKTGGTSHLDWQVVTISDFAAGNAGDVLYLAGYLFWEQAQTPFQAGYLKLRQVRGDVEVLFDHDGTGGSDTYRTIALFQNVALTSLTAHNFGGWDPALAAPAARSYTGTAGADRIAGTVGADTITGALGDDELRGFEGHDIITGGDGHDQIFGGGGGDQIDGGAGSDVIEDAGAGSDSITGGLGNDTIRVRHTVGALDEVVTINAGDGDDWVEAVLGQVNVGLAALTIDLGTGNDRLLLSSTSRQGTDLTLGSGVDVVSFEIGFQVDNQATILIRDFAPRCGRRCAGYLQSADRPHPPADPQQ